MLKKIVMAMLVGTAMPVVGHAANIGVAMVYVDEPFSVAMLDGMKDAAAKSGDHLQIEVADNDISKQINEIQNMIAAKVDAIVVNVVDTDITPKITKLAADAGIPLVYVNRMPSEKTLPKGVMYVGSDEADSGTQQMKEVCRLLKGKGEIVVIMGDLANQAARQRTQDIKDVIATPACSGIKINEEQTANWRRSDAMDLVTNWLTAGMKPDAIVANNDEMAIGALQALQSVGTKMDEIVVAGIDATQDGLAAMKAGQLDVTVFQDAHGQGAGAIQAARDMIDKKSEGGNISWIPFELVTPANMAKYVAK